MNFQHFKGCVRDGLWRHNSGLAQILGLCPILAISTSMVNAVSLGLATVVVMAISNLVISALRRWIAYEIRIPAFILIIAALVTVLDLAFNAYLHSLYLLLGIFIPLITTNCIVLARAEAFAAKNGVFESTLDGIMMGLGLVWVLGLLGALRELISNGTLFSGIDMIVPGLSAIQVFGEDYPGFLLASLPPGAFFTLALLVAGFNAINTHRAAKKAAPAATPPTTPTAPAPAAD
ncbi:MAG: electron transport complex subunit E [Azoarcus sp.]|nr:electron transport complex subunit E [Azoarcus sp.]